MKAQIDSFRIIQKDKSMTDEELNQMLHRRKSTDSLVNEASNSTRKPSNSAATDNSSTRNTALITRILSTKRMSGKNIQTLSTRDDNC